MAFFALLDEKFCCMMYDLFCYFDEFGEKKERISTNTSFKQNQQFNYQLKIWIIFEMMSFYTVQCCCHTENYIILKSEALNRNFRQSQNINNHSNHALEMIKCTQKKCVVLKFFQKDWKNSYPEQEETHRWAVAYLVSSNLAALFT